LSEGVFKVAFNFRIFAKIEKVVNVDYKIKGRFARNRRSNKNTWVIFALTKADFRRCKVRRHQVKPVTRSPS
jgi:hypothetical protein